MKKDENLQKYQYINNGQNGSQDQPNNLLQFHNQIHLKQQSIQPQKGQSGVGQVPYKRQKSIKVNLNDQNGNNAHGGIGIRKSSDVILQDTFRGNGQGEESNDRLTTQNQNAQLYEKEDTEDYQSKNVNEESQQNKAYQKNQVYQVDASNYNQMVDELSSGIQENVQYHRLHHLVHIGNQQKIQQNEPTTIVVAQAESSQLSASQINQSLVVPKTQIGVTGALANESLQERTYTLFQGSIDKQSLVQESAQININKKSQKQQETKKEEKLSKSNGFIQKPNKQTNKQKYGINSLNNDDDNIDLSEFQVNRKLINKKFANKQKSPKNEMNLIDTNEEEMAIGPGYYDPIDSISKKQAPAFSWGASKVKREENLINKHELENPGPANYNQQQHSIGMKMMKDILQQETVLEDKNKGQNNYWKLVQKLSQKAKNDYEQKKEKHIMRKKYMANKVQPGAHQNIFKQSDFQIQKKKDYLQFFGTTDAKIQENNFITNKNEAVGPGTYNNFYKTTFKDPQIQQVNNQKRANTAGFASNRKDLLFSGNQNPGPQDYQSQQNSLFSQKNWQTNIGAFGTTEKKFAFSQKEIQNNSSVPGPGEYSSISFIQKKYNHRKIKGQLTKIKNYAPSSFFTSMSTRQIDDNLEKNLKFHWPAAGQYEENRSLGQFQLQGGAPNNFLLLKNNKSAAPFQSTVARFKNAVPHALMHDLGPGQYSTEQNFNMCMDKKNQAATLYPGIQREQAFSTEPRWKDEKVLPKNFRIGTSGPQPCVGQYNIDSSSFSKKRWGYYNRFI